MNRPNREIVADCVMSTGLGGRYAKVNPVSFGSDMVLVFQIVPGELAEIQL